MKLSHFSVIGFFLILSQTSMAMSICLHARKGHSFVTVQDGNKIVKSLGLWPNRLLNEKHPTNVSIDRSGDRPVKTAPDVKTCSELKISVKALEQKAVKYTDKSEYGPYSLVGNNCTHFAVRMFNYGSGEQFPVVLSPARVMSIIGDSDEGVDETAANR